MRRPAPALPLVTLATLATLLAPPVVAEAQFRHDDIGIEFTVPDYFMAQGEDLLAPPSRVRCWHAPAEDGQPWIFLCLEKLTELPRSEERFRLPWRDGTVAASRSRIEVGDGEVVQFSALLPLHHGNVRLDVTTPPRGAAEAKAVLEEVLATVVDVGPWTVPKGADGEGRRNDTMAADERLGRAIGKIVGGLIAAGVAGVIAARRRKRRAEGEAAAV